MRVLLGAACSLEGANKPSSKETLFREEPALLASSLCEPSSSLVCEVPAPARGLAFTPDLRRPSPLLVAGKPVAAFGLSFIPEL